MIEEEVTVRIAAPGDLGFLELKSGLSRERLLQKIQRDEILILSVDDQPVGHLWFSFLWSEIPFIDLIYIKEECRKRGLSRVLLGYLEAYLQAHSFDVLYSSSQMDEPEPQAWHRHLGFTECGVIAGLNDGGIGEVFFRKAIYSRGHY
jgi:predicted GNAT superfamily acetyltransferase